MQVISTLAGNDQVAASAAEEDAEHCTELAASLLTSPEDFSSLQQGQAQVAGQTAATSDADTSLTAVTVHKYPVDKQLLLQVRLRQGRIPASVVCTPARGIPVMPAAFGKVSPRHVGPAAHKDLHISNAANTSPVAYRASVYRALQLHDPEAGVAPFPSPTAGESHIAPTTLPHFQSLHAAGSNQPAAVNDDGPFAAGLEQHLIADPSIHENDVPMPDIAPVEQQKPLALCVQPQKPDTALTDYTSAAIMSDQALASYTTSESRPSGETPVDHFLPAPLQEGAQPAPAYAWSTEQLTAIATAAATAAAAAFQQQAEHRMLQGNARATEALTVHHAQQAAQSAGLLPPIASSADLPQQGPSQCNQKQSYSAATPVPPATAAALEAVQPDNPRAAQPLRQQHQQQQTAIGKNASLKQVTALHKLKRRTSALRASTGSHRESIELADKDVASSEQVQAVAVNPAARAAAAPAIEVQPQNHHLCIQLDASHNALRSGK